MKKVVPEKRGRGRPRTVAKSVNLTLLSADFEAVDAYAAREGISRLEACRRLIRLGYETANAPKRRK